MKKILIVFLFAVIFGFAHAQNLYTLNDDKNYIDSLETLITQTKSDSVKCLNLFKLSDLFRRSKNMILYDSCLERANRIAPRFIYLRDLSVYFNAASFLKEGNIDEYERQLVLANQKLKKYKEPSTFSFRAFIVKNMSVLQQMKNNEKEATRILIDEAIPLAKKSGDHEVTAGIYTALGLVFMNNDNRLKASYYLKLAISHVEKAKLRSYNFQETKVHAYINNAENATQLSQTADAWESLDKAYSILKHYPESNMNAIYCQALGLLYHGLRNYEMAIVTYNLGIRNTRLHNDLAALKRLTFVKSQALSKLSKYREARDLLIHLDEKKLLTVEDAKMAYHHIIINSEKINDTKTGYKYCRKYISLTDSLYNTNSKKEIAEMEARYNSAEKEKEIVQLEAQKQNAVFVAERTNLKYLLLGLLSFALLLIVGFLWKNASSQKKLAVEKEKNYTQNLTALKNLKEIEVMQASIRGEEEERKRIARDLHDGIGSRLSGLKMRLMNKKDLSAEESLKEKETITELINTSISELRQVAYNLVPETLLRLGLEQALRDLCHSFQTEKVSITFHASEINPALAESSQKTIFRIIQELINNALKHSECSEIIVDCSQNENLFLITVEDNGVGFEKQEPGNSSGLGLKNIKNRIDLLNGKLEIETALNKGTVFNIELNL